MGEFIVAIANFLFPIMKMEPTDTQSSSEPETTVKPFLPMNEHAYYVNRLESRIRDAHRDKEREDDARYYATYGRHNDYDMYSSHTDYRKLLRSLHLKTLRMLDSYPRLHEVGHHELSSAAENHLLRNCLTVSVQAGNEEHSLSQLERAITAIQEHHEMPSDLSGTNRRTLEAVSASCNFLISTRLFKGAPPRLTDFVMRHPNRVDDIIDFMKLHCNENDAAHNIDLKHLENYLDCPAPSLREGML